MTISKIIYLSMLLFIGLIRMAKADDTYSGYALDDAHNHDGTHVEGQENCGTNYMFPGDIARLGSHSFIILGQEDENHILADHRSGTPPHTYQFILRIRLDPDEMALYKKLLKESKLMPAFTTIYYDDKDPKKQLDRTFFCLTDLPKIFGDDKKKGDQFEKIFPIRASLQKDADFEGAFEIVKSIYPGGHFTINRDDVELIIYKYLPSYLEQKSFRKAIKERSKEIVPLLSDAPLYSTEPVAEASKHKSYISTDGAIAAKNEFCPKDFYLKNTPVPKTIHTFLLMAELDPHTVLAVHYYDQAPHNFQTALKIKLSDEGMKIYRQAKSSSKTLPMFQTRVFLSDGKSEDYYLCMADIKKQVSDGSFHIKGTVFKDSGLNQYQLGKAVGTLDVKAADVQILTNRNLLSLMNPVAVAKDVLGKDYEKALKK